MVIYIVNRIEIAYKMGCLSCMCYTGGRLKSVCAVHVQLQGLHAAT